jgi:hypothetical protein
MNLVLHRAPGGLCTDDRCLLAELVNTASEVCFRTTYRSVELGDRIDVTLTFEDEEGANEQARILSSGTRHQA